MVLHRMFLWTPSCLLYGITDFSLASNFYIQQPYSCSLSDPVGNAKPLQLIFGWSPNAKYLSLFIYLLRIPFFTDDYPLMNSIGFDEIGFSVIQQILLNSC